MSTSAEGEPCSTAAPSSAASLLAAVSEHADGSALAQTDSCAVDPAPELTEHIDSVSEELVQALVGLSDRKQGYSKDRIAQLQKAGETFKAFPLLCNKALR